jgi:predicted XRE-type DNA-binding protein
MYIPNIYNNRYIGYCFFTLLILVVDILYEIPYKKSMIKTMRSDDERIVKTLHPFAGLLNSEERFAKILLAPQINLLLEERGLKQREAAELLGITQPDVSNLATGRLSGFTFDRLYRCLSALDMDVEITIKRHLVTEVTPASIHVSCL